jgi:hypothetical protein
MNDARAVLWRHQRMLEFETTPPFAWQCPHCARHATITDADYARNAISLRAPSAEQLADLSGVYVACRYVLCPNPDCRNRSLDLLVRHLPTASTLGDPLIIRRLIPESQAKAFPEYVPTPVIDDYNEACLIAELSPKASATLSRRCLQGMIRDCWDVRGLRTLKDEIDAIEDRLDPLTWRAIDGVRSIGNIGAHMEQDINTLVDVDQGEAETLIALIEQLIRDWYVVPFERKQASARIIGIAESKRS